MSLSIKHSRDCLQNVLYKLYGRCFLYREMVILFVLSKQIIAKFPVRKTEMTNYIFIYSEIHSINTVGPTGIRVGTLEFLH